MKSHRYSPHMVFACHVATNSPDPSTQVGAVLLGTSDKLIGIGWNDFPDGVDVKHWHGTKQEKYDRVVHAEVASILSAGLVGHATKGSTMVSPWAACANCAKHMVAAGVRKLVRHPHGSDNHWKESYVVGDEILRQGGVQIEEIPEVHPGVALRRNGLPWPRE